MASQGLFRVPSLQGFCLAGHHHGARWCPLQRGRNGRFAGLLPMEGAGPVWAPSSPSLPLWSWDVSKLKGPAKWSWFYLYVILDLFSRYAVGWTVQHRETAAIASALISQAIEQQRIEPGTLTVH